MFAEVERKLKKGNALLFSRDSLCLRELGRLMEGQSHRVLILWALDCAEAPLALFEAKYPLEPRPRAALEVCAAWARGQVKMPTAKRAILDAHAVAGEIGDRAYGALCHAVGHAGATVHVQTHAMGLPIYELTALVLLSGEGGYRDKVLEKADYYCRRFVHWRDTADSLDIPWAGFLSGDGNQAARNPDCPCRRKCPRHGDCEACRANHTGRGGPPFCERLIKK